ncbi:MAG: lamin tail domain-containing protein, partial [Candidatus Eisenbacteria sp.]|nr:lamin tail domain-containing protein [Candidatus Eisenbacteria bacterium]
MNSLAGNALARRTLLLLALASLGLGFTPGTAVTGGMMSNGENLPPVCKDGQRDIDLPGSSDEVTITVIAYDDVLLDSVELMVDADSGYGAAPMFDDGLHGDGAAGDSVFGAIIPPYPNSTLVRYYALATDDIGQGDFWPEDAPEEYRAYTVGHELPWLQITEVLAKNINGIIDEFGEHEDWIEIHNPGSTPVDLGGMYLTDDLDRTHRWMLPPHVLIPDEYLIVWADDEEEQGDYHACFKLSTMGESAGLFDTEDQGNVLIHGFKFGRMSADVSVGYQFGHEHFPEYLAIPTPGATNASSPFFSSVCINEFLTTSAFGGIDDWVELYNRGISTVDIGGWLLSDERDENTKWAFPVGTLLGPGEYLVIYEDALGFGWSSDGNEVIMLTAADSLTGMDFYDFGPQNPDISEGRCLDGVGFWYFFANPTPGSMNTDPLNSVDDELPVEVAPRLLLSRPNPFGLRTHLLFELGTPGDASIVICSADGRRVRGLSHGPLDAGLRTMAWDGRDDAGRLLSSGVYFASVQTGQASYGIKDRIR